MSTSQFDPNKWKTDQRHSWGVAAPGWMKWWPTQGGSLQSVSERLLELAGVQQGQRVLDLATGIGEPALTAALRVGPSGHVLATDISPEMLEFGKSRAAEMGLQNVDFREMDAENIDLQENSVDVILCRFGLMFLPNLDGALQTMLRLLVPGGRLAAAVWGPADRVASSAVARRAVLRELELPAPPEGTPDPYRLSDPASFEQKLTAAGFTNVRTEPLVVLYNWPSPDAYVEFAEDMMSLVKTALANQPADKQARIRAAIREGASEHTITDGTVHMKSEAILAVAQRG